MNQNDNLNEFLLSPLEFKEIDELLNVSPFEYSFQDNPISMEVADLEKQLLESNFILQEFNVKSLLLNHHKEELEERGYTVIKEVLNEEEVNEISKKMTEHMEKVTSISGNKLKHFAQYDHNAGHSEAQWLVRNNEKVIKVFEDLLETNSICSSFEGFGYSRFESRVLTSFHCHQPRDEEETFTTSQIMLDDVNGIDNIIKIKIGSHLMKSKLKRSSKGRYFQYSAMKYSSGVDVANLKLKRGDMLLLNSKTLFCNRNESRKPFKVSNVTMFPRSKLSIDDLKLRMDSFIKGSTCNASPKIEVIGDEYTNLFYKDCFSENFLSKVI